MTGSGVSGKQESVGRVAGKVALVTGAGTGIGRATSIRLAQEGAQVIVTSRSPEHVAETCSLSAPSASVEPIGLDLDVADLSSVGRAVEAVSNRFGRVDIVSNNAGIDYPHEPLVDELTDDEWERILRVNLTGMFYVCRAVSHLMRSGGSIVNVGSADALSVRPRAAAYIASKAAVMQFTRALAVDFAPRGIRANCVSPGVIDTPLTDAFLAAVADSAHARDAYAASNPMRRIGTPAEVANCILFLASDEASFVTGANLVVDGGATA